MSRGRRFLILFVLAFGTLTVLGGCGSKASGPDFAKLYDQAMTIQNGQSEAEVIALMGEPIERSEGDPENGTRLVYSAEKATGNNIIVVIKDGKVFSGVATRNGTVTPFGR